MARISRTISFPENHDIVCIVFLLNGPLESRIPGLNIRSQLEAPNAKPGSALRMEVDISGKILE